MSNISSTQLVHETFRPDLIMWSWEDGKWDQYDWQYLQNLKRLIKKQLQENFGNIQGKKFKIYMPRVLRKQIPLIMAIWDLGGIVVIDHVNMWSQRNPKYSDWYLNIDYCLLENGDIQFMHADQELGAFKDRIYELKYFFSPNDDISQDLKQGTADDPAIMVITSGSLAGPEIAFFTHRQIILAMESAKVHGQFRADEHVLHVNSLHHGSLCVNYLLPSLQVCKNHYYKITHDNESLENWPITILELASIDRILWMIAFDQKLTDSLNNVDIKNKNLILQAAFSPDDAKFIDQVFATGKVARYLSIFGCSELPTSYMIQQATRETWPALKDHWNVRGYQTVPSGYWQYKVTEQGLAVKSEDMDDWFQTADQFELNDNGQYTWLGRTTQIKRGATTVVPEAIEAVLNQVYSHLDLRVVPDYHYKKIYVFVFKNKNSINDQDLLNSFNQEILKHLDSEHTVDLVMTNAKDVIHKNRLDLPLLRFFARKKLCLS
jgi:acyl-CoA synthetase (AMP-forming)/AMP-acid ligase II